MTRPPRSVNLARPGFPADVRRGVAAARSATSRSRRGTSDNRSRGAHPHRPAPVGDTHDDRVDRRRRDHATCTPTSSTTTASSCGPTPTSGGPRSSPVSTDARAARSSRQLDDRDRADRDRRARRRCPRTRRMLGGRTTGRSRRRGGLREATHAAPSRDGRAAVPAIRSSNGCAAVDQEWVLGGVR